MVEPILDIKDLTISLPSAGDRLRAVSSLSLKVHPRETLCLVGESGSGKSMTAHAIMRLLPRGIQVTGGIVGINGENLLAASPGRMRQLRGKTMSMIFQEPMTSLNPVERCGAQIDEVLRLHVSLTPSQRREKVLSIMYETRLPDPKRIYESYPHQLSGGQRQRIMIAMAMILEPSLLIADEPTTALDVTTQAQILEMIAELKVRHGTAVLFITHDFGVVSDIADSVAVMRHGELLEHASVHDVFRQPKHAYTKTLIDAVPALEPPQIKRRLDDCPLLTIRNLSKVYSGGGLFVKQRQIAAAENVSFEIRPAEILGVVGESGSGKSTVARCVSLLIKPSSGQIVLDGQDLLSLSSNEAREVRRKVQIVFQDPFRSLNPRRTIGQSLVEGPMNFGMSKAQAVDLSNAMLEVVRISPDTINRYPHQFSGGQRQRICIARALVMKPKLLIADEAVSALDVSVQAEVLDLLKEIRDARNLSIMFITHDLRVAAEICDSIVVMEKGRVVEAGTALAVLKDPKTDYARLLLNAIPGKRYLGGKLREPVQSIVDIV